MMRLSRQFQAAHAGHHDVGEHEFGPGNVLMEDAERFFAAGGLDHLVAGTLGQVPHQCSNIGFIVDDQNHAIIQTPDYSVKGQERTCDTIAAQWR